MAREYNAGSRHKIMKSRLNSGVVGMSGVVVVTGWSNEPELDYSRFRDFTIWRFENHEIAKSTDKL